MLRNIVLSLTIILTLLLVPAYQNCGKSSTPESSGSSPRPFEQALSNAISLTPAKIAGGRVCRSTRTFDFYTSWGQYTGSEMMWLSMDYNSDGSAKLTTATATTGRSYSYGNWEIDANYGKIISSVVGNNSTLRIMAAFNDPIGGQVVVDGEGRVWQCCDDIYGTYTSCSIPP